MTLLLLGLVMFLGVHSVRIVAEGWRGRMLARLGPGAWYALLSLAGLVLITWGYGAARMQPLVLWAAPLWTRHLAALLTLPAFVMLVAAYVPGNAIKARLRHPMVLGVKTWSPTAPWPTCCSCSGPCSTIAPRASATAPAA